MSGVHHGDVVLVQAFVESLPSGCVKVIAVMLERPLPSVRLNIQRFAVILGWIVGIAHHVADFMESSGEIARVGDLPDPDGFLFAIRPIGP